MNNFFARLNEIVEKISFLENKRMKAGKFLRELNKDFSIGPNREVADKKIINPITAKTLDKLNVMAVDGGIVKHSFHGLDMLLMRSAAVNFKYSKGKLKDVVYYPNSHPTPNPKIVYDAFSDFELNSCYNFERQIMEVETTIAAMEKLKPDIVLLDGSIIPHYVPRPDNLVLKESYNRMIEHYKKLFETSKKNKILLAGVIEDSRGVKFCDILQRQVLPQIKDEIVRDLKLILEKTKDSNLLSYVLDKGERTCIFNYSKNPMVHPVLKEFETLSNQFFSFYIKTVEFDRPLRVDFLNTGKETEIADTISSFLMQTSGHSGYGLPAVLIEADMKTKLSERDINMFYADLINKVGNVSSLFKMRREMRPFK